MTAQQQHIPHPLSTGTDYEQLAARFRPIFTRIAAGASNASAPAACPMSR